MKNAEPCFLCKVNPGTTDEHVFPRWLQREFSLWDQQIGLPNNTPLPYRKLRVACCSDCNSKHLNAVEQVVRPLVQARNVPGLLAARPTTCLWLHKIMYSVHYNDAHLVRDRTDPSAGYLADKGRFQGPTATNLFPSAARGIVVFEEFSPYSLFVFRIAGTGVPTFFYIDEPLRQFAAIVLGSVGVVLSVQDDGYIERDVFRHTGLVQGQTLSLPDFGFFAAMLLNLKMRMRLDQLPNYEARRVNGRLIFRLPQQPMDVAWDSFDPTALQGLAQTYFHPLFASATVTDGSGQRSIRYSPPFRVI